MYPNYIVITRSRPTHQIDAVDSRWHGDRPKADIKELSKGQKGTYVRAEPSSSSIISVISYEST